MKLKKKDSADDLKNNKNHSESRENKKNKKRGSKLGNLLDFNEFSELSNYEDTDAEEPLNEECSHDPQNNKKDTKKPKGGKILDKDKSSKNKETFRHSTDESSDSTGVVYIIDETDSPQPHKHKGKLFFRKNEELKFHQIPASDLKKEEDLGYPYIQMRLPVEKITPEYEASLKKKITKEVKIRRAKEEDIPKLVEMYNRAFLSAADPYSPMTEEDMRQIFYHNKTIILIGSIWGVDAGFIILDFEGENNEIGVVAGLGTLPSWQKRGVGTSIGIESWKYFKQINPNLKELRCEVYKYNIPSYRLIKGMGFEEFGVKYYKF
ncbi:MAG: GNAT family N-acetyltransferase [Promethearchaeota archaeon]